MTEYLPDVSLERAITAALEDPRYNEFEGLRKSGVKFTSCVRHETDKNGDSVPCKGPLVATKKVSDLHRLWIPAKYIIVVDHAAWTTADTDTQGFMVHTALRNVAVTMADDGSFKFGVNKPNICVHSISASRFPEVEDVVRVRTLLVGNGEKMMAPHIGAGEPDEKKSAKKQK